MSFVLAYAIGRALGSQLIRLEGALDGPAELNSNIVVGPLVAAQNRVAIAEIFSRSAAELALFAGAGFLLFGLNDLLVDFIYFTRRIWRAWTVYRRHQRSYA